MNRIKYFEIWLPLLAVIFLSQCRKPTSMGADLLPPEDQINVVQSDTFSLFTEIVLEDSLETFASANFAVGSKDETIFGKSLAGLYFQPTLTTNNLDLQGSSSSFQFDSLVLQMVYADFYGDTAVNQTWELLQMDPSVEFYDDTVYHSNESFLTSALLASKTFLPRPDQTVALQNGDSLSPHVRIKLDDVFGAAFMNSDPTVDFANNDAFIDAYPGFYLSPDVTGTYSAGIANLDVYNTQSKLVLYYQLDGDTSSRSFDFPISTESAFCNAFAHDYTGSEVDALIGGSVDQVDNYLSGLSGVKTKISIPSLSKLDKVTINQAKLTLSIINDGMTSLTYPEPEQILLVKIDSNGGNFFIGTSSISMPEQIVFGSDFYGGKLESGSPATYTFNIPLYTQDIVNGDEDNIGLYLITFPNFRRPDRVKIGGPNHPLFPLTLDLHYTKND